MACTKRIMAPKKKAPNNGYFYLLMELRDKMGMQRAGEEAARLWPMMSAAEREPYNSRAKKIRSAGKGEKMTALNENMQHVLKQEEEEKNQENIMKQYIRGHLSYIMKNQSASKEYFHIMHVNNFFVTTDNVYYPAEIAVVRFNLEEGVIGANVYHSIIRPGQFPIGYMGTAKLTSDNTHKIPYIGVEDSNMDTVCEELFGFLQESADLTYDSTTLPPIYVKDDIRKIAIDVLQQMAGSYDYDPDKIRVYSLSTLLHELRNTVANEDVWPSVSQSICELERDIFDLTPDISCEFHKMDSPVHCSRSHVIRMAYIVCDHCCADLGIKLRPGYHVPLDSMVEEVDALSVCTEETKSIAGATSYSHSVAPSFRSNINTIDFEDNSTTTNENDWWDASSQRSVRTQKTVSACETAQKMPQPSKNSQGPRSDWRQSNFGRGRGRGIAHNK